jgi:peptidoglycan/xylan/chitin deacetylase (PgdA/CDA1 family)
MRRTNRLLLLRMRSQQVVALALLAASAPPAAAKGWPTPAAGDSTSGGPEVIFTFDDGPRPSTTPAVLDVLAAHHIHAIFFMIGEMAANKSKKVKPLIDRIVAEGHIIGTHTMTHPNLCKIKDDDKAAAEIDDGKRAVEEAAGLRTVWFRVPGGARCDRLEKQLAERGLAHFHWDIDMQEWKHHNVDRAVKTVVDQLAKNSDRVVVLMHDIHKETPLALPRILDWIDQENAKRLAVHKKPIRIVNGYEYAEEQLPKGLVAWLGGVVPDFKGMAADVAEDLP